MVSTVEEIKHHVKVYVLVFVALAFLTLVTVTVAFLHLSTPSAIGVALLIASVKGSLVAAYFMHLISEKKVIYFVLILAAIFFAGMIVLITFGHFNKPQGTVYVP